MVKSLINKNMFNIIARFVIAFIMMLQMFLACMPLVKAESNAPTNFIISAVQITGGSGHTQEDFIELYNPTGSDIDLKGYRLVKRTAVGTTDTVIKSWSESAVVSAHHFYLWANSAFPTNSVQPDITTTSTLADNNAIALRLGSNDSGTIIDSVAWGNTTNGFENSAHLNSNPGANESLLRDKLFEINSGFSIAGSNPRNSTSEVLPIVQNPPVEETAPEPEPDPTPQPEPTTEPIPNPETTTDTEPIPVPEPDPIIIPEPNADSGQDTVQVIINEILPNPTGVDAGAEKIELYNPSQISVDLTNWILDDVSNAGEISDNALILNQMEVTSKGYFVITIPKGKFAMNNSSGDVVTLFDQNKNIKDSISFTDSTPEAKSYSKFGEVWKWAESTFGQSNGDMPAENLEDDEDAEQEEETTVGNYDNSGLKITEVYPSPKSGTKEFIELFNGGEEVANLSGVTLWVGDKHKLLESHEIQPGEYFVIESLPAQLRNTGQTIKLVNEDELLQTVNYPEAIKEASYSFFEDGFLWTTNVTKGTDNILQLPEVTKKEVTKTITQTKKTQAAKTPATKKVSASSKKTTAKSVSAKSTTKSNTNVKNLNTSQPSETLEELTPSTDTKKKEPIVKVIAMGAAAAAAGVVALYKLVFSAGLE
jgi:hypothetical protein